MAFLSSELGFDCRRLLQIEMDAGDNRFGGRDRDVTGVVAAGGAIPCFERPVDVFDDVGGGQGDFAEALEDFMDIVVATAALFLPAIHAQVAVDEAGEVI